MRDKFSFLFYLSKQAFYKYGNFLWVISVHTGTRRRSLFIGKMLYKYLINHMKLSFNANAVENFTARARISLFSSFEFSSKVLRETLFRRVSSWKGAYLLKSEGNHFLLKRNNSFIT